MIRREFYDGTAQTFTFSMLSGGVPVVLDGYTVRFKGRSDSAAIDYLVVIPPGATSVDILYSAIAAGTKVVKGKFHVTTPTPQYLRTEPLHITVR